MPGSQTRHPSDLSQCLAVLPSPPGLSGGAPLLQDKGMATLAARHLQGPPAVAPLLCADAAASDLVYGHTLPTVVPVDDRPVPSLPPTPLARRPGTPTRSASWGWTRLGAATPGGPRFSCSVSRKGGGFFTTREQRPSDRPTAGQTCGLHHLRCLSRVSPTVLPAHASRAPRPGGRAPGAEDVSAACT